MALAMASGVRAGWGVEQGAESWIVIDPAHETADCPFLGKPAKRLPYGLMACKVKEVLWGKDVTPAIAVYPRKYLSCYILGHSKCLFLSRIIGIFRDSSDPSLPSFSLTWSEAAHVLQAMLLEDCGEVCLGHVVGKGAVAQDHGGFASRG